MIIDVDLSSGRALYMQIADGVRRAIVEGRLEPGDRLPSGRDLAKALGVNLETVQRAYRALVDEGVVTSRVGRGTRVAESLRVEQIRVENLVDELVVLARRLGMSPDEVTSLVGQRFEGTPG